MTSKKDHDMLDTKAAAMAAIRWELGRYARRMQETAFRVIDEQVTKSIKEGRIINALEISEIAVNEAKRAAVGAAPATPRKRIARSR